ncbi:MAG: hypothetical protein ABSG88_02085 [Bradyrhizobium sp.]
MLNTLKQNSWWLAITLAGAYQQGALVPGAAAIVIATLLKAIAHAIWLSLPQRWRDQLAPSRARITVPLRKSQANNQEHHHAYQ